MRMYFSVIYRTQSSCTWFIAVRPTRKWEDNVGEKTTSCMSWWAYNVTMRMALSLGVVVINCVFFLDKCYSVNLIQKCKIVLDCGFYMRGNW